MNVLKLQNLCSTLKIHIWCNGRNPKTRASYWSFVFREQFCCGLFVNPHIAVVSRLFDDYAKLLKRIQCSFSNHRCHHPHQMNHIRCNSFRNNFQCSHQGITLKMHLILNPTKPFTGFWTRSSWKIGNFGLLGTPWTYVKALAAWKLCGFFPYAIKQTLWGTYAAHYEVLRTSVWKKGTFPFHITYIILGEKGREKRKWSAICQNGCVSLNKTEGLRFEIKQFKAYLWCHFKQEFIYLLQWCHLVDQLDGSILGKGGSIFLCLFLVDVSSVRIDYQFSRVSKFSCFRTLTYKRKCEDMMCREICVFFFFF